MPAKKQPKRSHSSERQPAEPVRAYSSNKDSLITGLAKKLSDWLDLDNNQEALSAAIHVAMTEYEAVRHNRQYPLGEPVVAPHPPTLSDPRFADEAAEPAMQEEDWARWTAKRASEFATAAVNAARFTYATTVDYALGNSAEELKKRYAVVTAENALSVFLELDQLKGGWDTDNHVQGTIGIGAASLKTRIVAKVIDAMLLDSKAPHEEDEDAFTMVDYSGKCLTTSQRQAHAVYNQLIGFRAAKAQHPEAVTVATTTMSPGS